MGELASQGRYYKVSPRIWQDPDTRNLWTEDMRLLALYLITSPHRNMTGLYYCPLSYMASDLRWISERLRCAFDDLIGRDFIRYDWATEVVFVRNALKYDAPTKGKQVAGAINVLQGVPVTSLLLDLLAAAQKHCLPLATEIESALKDTLEVLRTSTEDTSKTHRGDIEDTPIPVSVSVSVSDSASASVVLRAGAADSAPPEDEEPPADPAPREDEGLPTGPSVPYTHIVNLYHQHCPTWPKVDILTPARRQSIREWWATLNGEMHRFELAFQKAGESDFLSGRNGKWKSPKPCDLDWLLKDSNLAVVLEGGYAVREPTTVKSKPYELPPEPTPEEFAQGRAIIADLAKQLRRPVA